VLATVLPASESVHEYLVIVNHGTGDAVVSYRPGVFTGPNLEAIAMLQNPMEASAKHHARIGRYWVMADERLALSSGVVTFTLSAGTAAMIGGIWPPTDDPPDDSAAFLEIVYTGRHESYAGDAVLSAFSRHARNLRVLAVQ
jgi:hypothetical protein